MLTFVHISDTHIHPDRDFVYNGGPPPYKTAVRMIEEVNNLPFKPDFILHTGDVAYDPIPEAYENCKTIFSTLKAPIYYTVGNHDHSEMLQKQLGGVEHPAASYHYMQEIGGVQLVVLDSNGPERKLPGGHITHEQLEWLSNICKTNETRHLIISVHHNILKSGVPWLDEYMITSNGEELHQALLPAKDRIRGVFFGHVHQNLEMYRDGILYCSAASSWVQFGAYPGMTNTTRYEVEQPGFNVVTLQQNSTFIRRYQFTVK